MKKIQLLFLFTCILLSCATNISTDSPIQPWTENPWYWQYKGEPLMMLGASSDDNPFQWPSEKLIPHLDSMKAIGANYVRCTMSDRQDKGFEAYPFAKNNKGKYDLNQLNEDYFSRFEFFLKETEKRDIIVQIEVWDRFDYARNHWPIHPFNPKNNVNYSTEESGLDLEYPDHPGRNVQPFFFTTPEQRNNELLLEFQKKRVEKILEVAFQYPNVLYCIDNETSGEEKWATYWANFIQNKADEAGIEICITQMWDSWDLTSEEHKRTFDHPVRYKFCDVSQNNHQKRDKHWDNFQWVKEYLKEKPRPVNTVKTYGADGGRHGSTKDALERWWKHVLGGAASARFHRQNSGLGLSELSINCVKVAREVEKVDKFWELDADNDLLLNRAENEAFLASKSGETYVVFFTDGGEVKLDLTGQENVYKLQWYDVRNGVLVSSEEVKGGAKIDLIAPGKLEWIALISKK
ncbi:MAG: hypothetical protein R3182_06920 [Draconibacterium sp.]|nr:hypothetical protein [Draconibacterium sp.]